MVALCAWDQSMKPSASTGVAAQHQTNPCFAGFLGASQCAAVGHALRLLPDAFSAQSQWQLALAPGASAGAGGSVVGGPVMLTVSRR